MTGRARSGASHLRRVGRALVATGAATLAIVALAYADAIFGRDAAIAAFERAEAADAARVDVDFEPEPDQSLWSAGAKTKYAQALRYDRVPAALLTIPRLEIKVPVFLGTDPITLNRGAGVVDGTARPGESGNVAISGHRDSFFRPLEHIAVGDVITLRTLDREQRYAVTDIRIVDPLDVDVLEPTEASVLTLITCYPFHYVGYAPDRFVVRARLTT